LNFFLFLQLQRLSQNHTPKNPKIFVSNAPVRLTKGNVFFLNALKKVNHKLPTTNNQLPVTSYQFMQNKPNFPDAQMNVTSFYTVDYENKSNWKLGENKANQSQYKPNTNPIPEMSK